MRGASFRVRVRARADMYTAHFSVLDESNDMRRARLLHRCRRRINYTGRRVGRARAQP